MANIHIAGKRTDEECPKGEVCTCGGKLEVEYGFCSYGLGGFDRCIECLIVFNFVEDT